MESTLKKFCLIISSQFVRIFRWRRVRQFLSFEGSAKVPTTRWIEVPMRPNHQWWFTTSSVYGMSSTPRRMRRRVSLDFKVQNLFYFKSKFSIDLLKNCTKWRTFSHAFLHFPSWNESFRNESFRISSHRRTKSSKLKKMFIFWFLIIITNYNSLYNSLYEFSKLVWPLSFRLIRSKGYFTTL